MQLPQLVESPPATMRPVISDTDNLVNKFPIKLCKTKKIDKNHGKFCQGDRTQYLVLDTVNSVNVTPISTL